MKFSLGILLVGTLLLLAGCQKEIKEIRNPTPAPALAAK